MNKERRNLAIAPVTSVKVIENGPLTHSVAAPVKMKKMSSQT